ncbi:ubiquinone/menaquinone biosynthesis methyltransferase [Agromyces sp. CFH 90414]|uniref:Demethylmenaquinone methyltransferase n=1 Tax=Agromyces agglutinans TaxID=2662258 RepID=A0A6I2FAK5_9MICO|nr:class I SAM-dependent methyltransferase [Agromyces agglutinans]MRG58993.1 ubiquinone/menaquinone biosynthesis methyltransferase [Agromyces agglutinans]
MVAIDTDDRPSRRDAVRPGLDRQPASVTAMFDRVAPRYDLLNLLMTGGHVTRWRQAATAALAPRRGEDILDVAAGTGTSSVPLAATGARVVASDPSPGMLAVGRRRHPHLDFVRADAFDLPFADATFDAVTITFGLRNIGDAERALREMARVCRPGGRLVVCEFSTPTTPLVRAGHRLVVRGLLPTLGRLASSDPPAYRYLADTVLDWPDQYALAAAIARCGWERVEHRNLSGGIVALHRATRPRGGRR